MFWNLVLAHQLGDFVFQNDWMVSKRDNLWVLSLHVCIHFILMVILAGSARAVIWPYLLLIAAIHLAQDRIKNSIMNKRPEWIRSGFIIDQGVHIVIIWAVVLWIQDAAGPLSAPEKPVGIMVFMTYLFVTYVWYISERLFNRSNSDYLQNINDTKFPRMLSRAGLVSLFLLVWGLGGAWLAMILSNPYPKTRFRQRSVLTDISVSLAAIVFLFWVFS